VDDEKKRDSFALLGNIYTFAAGQDPRRPRIANDYVVHPPGEAKTKIQAARIKYDGDFDLEPGSLRQLGAMLAARHGIELQVEAVTPQDLTSKHRLAFLGISSSAPALGEAQVESMRKWAEAGGTLWIDAVGGDSAAALQV